MFYRRRLEREKIGANEVGDVWECVSEPDKIEYVINLRAYLLIQFVTFLC